MVMGGEKKEEEDKKNCLLEEWRAGSTTPPTPSRRRPYDAVSTPLRGNVDARTPHARAFPMLVALSR